MIETMPSFALVAEDGFLSGIQEAEQDVLAVLAREMADDAAEIARRFRAEDLSGRKPDDTGLNKITGKLHDSIMSSIEVNGDEIIATVFNEGASYWYYHEVGAGHNPKRLDWFQRFAVEGSTLFEDAGVRAAEEAFA